jgi:hypothetical protein
MARGEDTDNIILGSTQRQREKKVCCNNKLWGQTKMQYKLLQQKRIGKMKSMAELHK